MTELSKKAKLLVTFPSGTVEVFPLTDDYSLDYDRDEDFGFYRALFSQSLLFCKEDYRLFLEHEKSCERCEPLPFVLRSKCEGVDKDEIVGSFNLVDAKFDISKCTVTIKPRVEDDYTCLLETWDFEKNILATNPKQTISTIVGNIVPQQCIGTNPPDFTQYYDCTNGIAWTVITHGGNDTTVDTLWAREEYSGAGVPPGDEWILDGSVWVRPVNVRQIFFFQDENRIDEQYEIINYEIDNGIKLSDALDFMQECGLSIVSDFFNINPDNTHPNNIAYDCAETDLLNLIIFQITDIKTPDAFQNANRYNIALIDLVKDLLSLFNIEFRIENGVWRLEHTSYFQAQQGIDLVSNYNASLIGNNSYDYIGEKIPKREEWIFPSTQSSNFDGGAISYNSCYDENTVSKYQLIHLFTDVYDILENPDNYGNAGLVIVSTVEFNGTNTILSQNKSMQLTNLQNCYWKHDRPQWSGVIGGQEMDFLSVKPTKRQVPLEIQLCCADFKDWNPSNLIKSQIGWGEVDTARYSFKNRCLEFTLLHKIENCDCDLGLEASFIGIRTLQYMTNGSGTNCTAQWQRFIASQNQFLDIPGETGMSMTFTGFGRFRVIISCDGCEEISNELSFLN